MIFYDMSKRIKSIIEACHWISYIAAVLNAAGRYMAITNLSNMYAGEGGSKAVTMKIYNICKYDVSNNL